MQGEKAEPMSKEGPPTRPHYSRREALVWAGATGVIWLMAGARTSTQAASDMFHPRCLVRPAQTEGPYFIDERLHRSDIRTDPTNGTVAAGTPLTLTFHVFRSHVGDCQPLSDAQVDIWHCDAKGVYSDVRDPGFDTTRQKFLRGYQMTDTQGIARFQTIYPGWYPIRTVHIHFKVRTAPVARRRYEFTSQVYFPDDLTDRVHSSFPYLSNGRRRVRNHHDFIFQEGGDRLMLEPTPTSDGYAATFSIGLQLSGV